MNIPRFILFFAILNLTFLIKALYEVVVNGQLLWTLLVVWCAWAVSININEYIEWIRKDI